MSLNASGLVVAAAVLLTAACSPGDTAATPTATTTGTTAVGTGTTSSAAPVTTTPGTTLPSEEPIFARCSTSGLRVALGEANGGAGHLFVPIVFTNTGVACTITGFPGVSYVGGADEHQIGDAAVRDPVATPVVLLRNGESATAWVDRLNVDVLDPAVCGPEPAGGLRVYPPDDTGSVVLPEPGARACAHHLEGQSQLRVRAVRIDTTPN